MEHNDTDSIALDDSNLDALIKKVGSGLFSPSPVTTYDPYPFNVARHFKSWSGSEKDEFISLFVTLDALSLMCQDDDKTAKDKMKCHIECMIVEFLKHMYERLLSGDLPCVVEDPGCASIHDYTVPRLLRVWEQVRMFTTWSWAEKELFMALRITMSGISYDSRAEHSRCQLMLYNLVVGKICSEKTTPS